MTEPTIYKLLSGKGILISLSTLSRMLTDHIDVFHDEKSEILAAGKRSSNYQGIDDTGARVKGKNHYTHILCNPYYTAYFTRRHKDRLTILDILSDGDLGFAVDDTAFNLMKLLGLPPKYWSRVELFCAGKNEILNREALEKWLLVLYPDPLKHSHNRELILEACALTAYKRREDAIEILICDDAPQFKSITGALGLCWIHDGRYYKKLNPFMVDAQRKLAHFCTEYWDFYRALLDYQKTPNEVQAQKLETRFDALFDQKTGYTQLDNLIAKTWAKKKSLLLVLQYPHIPLHNNAAELGARRQACYRKVSQQTQNKKGTDAKDSFMTIEQTARKLGVNFMNYIKDRLTGLFEMPSLASLILSKSGVAAA